MFSTKCLELVKAQQVSDDNFDYNKYNKELLQYHSQLLKLNTGSRSVCTKLHRPTKVRCTKCTKCKGHILYNLWCLDGHIEGCFDVLNDNRQDLKLKEACFYYLNKYRAERLKALKEARYHGL